ncbi:MAG: oligosaccharide flippase family protein [Polyangiaceae bacterium]
MTRLASLGKNSIVYGLGQVLTRALSVLFLPLLTRYLSPADYGAIGLVTILNAVLQPALAFGTGMSLGPNYFRSEDPQHRRNVIGSALVFNSAGALVVLAVGYLFSAKLAAAFGRPELGPLLPYGLAMAAFAQPLSVVQLWLQFTERSRASVLLTLVQTVSTFGCALYFVVKLGWGARGMLAASTLGTALGASIGAALLLRQLKLGFSGTILRRLLRDGAPLLGGIGANFLLNNGPRLVLERNAGLTVLGYFTLGAQLALPMDLAVSAFTTAWYPFFMSFTTRQQEAPRVFGRALRLYLWGFGAVAMLAFAFARFGVRLVAAPQFEPAFMAVGLIATSRVLWGLYNIVVPGLYFSNKLGHISVLQLAAAAVAIATTYAILPFSPLLGCVSGIVVGHLALVAIQVLWNRRHQLQLVEVGNLRGGRLFILFVALSVPMLLPRSFTLLHELALAVGVGALIALLVAAFMPAVERSELLAFVAARVERLRRR